MIIDYDTGQLPAVPESGWPKPVLTPTTPTARRHNYEDPSTYYVSRDYFAAGPGEMSVFLDDELELLEETLGEDGRSLWCRVRERQSGQSGLVPMDIVESGMERLAKENRVYNESLVRRMRGQAEIRGRSQAPQSRSKRVQFQSTSPTVWVFESDAEPHRSSGDLAHQLEAEIFQKAIEESSAEEPEIKKTSTPTNSSFMSGLFGNRKDRTMKQKPPTERSSNETESLTASLKAFTRFSDHLIRVYIGNFMSLAVDNQDGLPAAAFKSFIVDEAVPLKTLEEMVVNAFGLASDPYDYELNLMNHLTGEIVPLNIDWTIAEVIEQTKRVALPYTAYLPDSLRVAQKKALKRADRRSKDSSLDRDKASDYVTPFKFVLNRVFAGRKSVPLSVSVVIEAKDVVGTGNSLAEPATCSRSRGSLLKRLFSFKKQPSLPASPEKVPGLRLVQRVVIGSSEMVGSLVAKILERLQVSSLPGVQFEAWLAVSQDCLTPLGAKQDTLPLPLEMVISDALQLHGRLDLSMQNILIRPAPSRRITVLEDRTTESSLRPVQHP